MSNMPPDPFSLDGEPQLGQLPWQELYLYGLSAQLADVGFPGVNETELKEQIRRGHAAYDTLRRETSPEDQGRANEQLNASIAGINKILGIDFE